MRNIELDITSRAAAKRADTAYNRTVGAVIVTGLIAAAIEPPTAYLVPLIVAAWAALIWAIRRESRPRYKRKQ